MVRYCVAFIACCCSLALAAQSPDVVAGRVLRATDGRAIPHARVTLVDISNERLAATAATDDSGHFRFDPVPHGKYRLTGLTVGYTAASYLPHGQYSTAVVTGAGLPIGELELRLTPTAAITGQVIDDNGEPIQRAAVQLYREDITEAAHVTRGRAVQTEDDGAFNFDHLAPGRYFVSATGTPWYATPTPFDPDNVQMPYRAAVDPALDVAYPTVFYPHALDSAEATAIVLSGGGQTHINLQLNAQHALTLTLRVAPSEPSNNNQRFPQLTRSVFGIEEPLNLGMSSTSDFRRITGIPPGRYNLQEITNGSGFPAGSHPVDLATTSLSLDMPPASELANVTANIHALDNTPLPSLQFTLRALHSDRVGGVRISDKGTAEVTNVPPGDYTLVINGGRRMHVVHLSVNGKAVPDKHLRITGGGSVPIDVTVSPTEVHVEGFAHREGKAAAVAAMVLLVPAGADTDAELFRRDQSDLDGSFSFADVIPGNYILIAIDDGWDLSWTDIRSLAPYLTHGIPVAISATGPNHVTLAEPVSTQPRQRANDFYSGNGFTIMFARNYSRGRNGSRSSSGFDTKLSSGP